MRGNNIKPVVSAKKFIQKINNYFVHFIHRTKNPQSESADHLIINIIDPKDKNIFYTFQCFNQSIPMPLLLYMETTEEIYNYIIDNPTQTLQIAEDLSNQKLKINKKILKIDVKVLVCNKYKTCTLLTHIIECNKFQFLYNQKIINTYQMGIILKNKIQDKRKTLVCLIQRQVELDEQNIKTDEQISLIQQQNQQLITAIEKLQRQQAQQKSLKIQLKKQQQKSAIMPVSLKLKPMAQSPLFKHVQVHGAKKNLFLSIYKFIKEGKGVGDNQIKQMIFYDWTAIQIVSLGKNKIIIQGGNKISDVGLRSLMKIQWPSISNLYLFSNHITDIACINLQAKLQILSLYENKLNMASCQHLLKEPWTLLTQLYISFDRKINEKCIEMIMKDNFKCFPSLKRLHFSEQFGISVQLRTKIQVLSNQKNIKITFGDVSIIDPNCQIY